MSFDWQPFAQADGEFAKFNSIGDEVVGKIANIRVHTFKEEKGPVPLIDLEPLEGGDTITLAVDKVDLKWRILEVEPQVGDLLAVKFVNIESTQNGTKKLFAIKHKVGERTEADPFAGNGAPSTTPNPADYSEDPF